MQSLLASLSFRGRPQCELSLRCFAAASMAHAVDFFPKCVDVLKRTIDGGEAHISYFIETMQLFHDELTHETRGHFAFAHRAQLVTNVRHCSIHPFARHRPLLQCFEHAVAKLLLIERLAALI